MAGTQTSKPCAIELDGRERYEIGDGLLIGRQEGCDIRLDSGGTASRRHARVHRDERGCWVEDLESTNGTFLNGERISGPTLLNGGDVVRIAGQDLLVLTDRAPAGLRTTPPAAPRDPSPAARAGAEAAPADFPATIDAGAREPAAGSAGERPPTETGPVPDAVRLDGGEDQRIGRAGLIVGRDPLSDIALPEAGGASRRHARIYLDDAGCWLEDLKSTNGTFVNGERVSGTRRLHSGDRVEIDSHELLLLSGAGTVFKGLAPSAAAARLAPEVLPQAVPYSGARLRIGRDPSNQLVLDDPNVSRFHAVIEPGPSGPALRDLGSRNGTRLEGRPVDTGALAPGAQIGIGPFRLTFTGRDIRASDERGAVSIEAVGVSVTVPSGQILAPTYMAIEPGELVAIIGQNGAGKSTLLKALAGVSQPTEGVTLLNGEPVAQRLTDVGYVPQYDTVHRHLTVQEALTFAAQLRLPNLSPSELQEVIDRVVRELKLEELRSSEKLFLNLSGGEQKRTCVAMELLSRPSVVFLDEPTSPLDFLAGIDLMAVLRDLAEGSRAVVMVTHHPDDVPLCDKVAVIARGGYLCYLGPPVGALEHFGVPEVKHIYAELEGRTGAEWAASPGGEVATARAAASPGAASARPGQTERVGRRPARIVQSRVLARRGLRLLSRDRINLGVLAGSVPFVAILFLLTFSSDTFATGSGPEPKAPTFLFFLLFVVILVGVMASVREIVRERAIFHRERATGVDPLSYLASKLLVLGGVGVLQSAVLGLLLVVLRPVHVGAGALAGAMLVLALTSITAVALGLATSAVARSEEQAPTLVPIVLIPQLLFGGAVIQLAGKGRLFKGLAALTPSRWSFSGIGAFARVGDHAGIRAGYGDFFTGPGRSLLVLLGFAVLLVAFVAWRLRRTSAV